MDNIVEGIRSRYFRAMSENSADGESNAQRKEPKMKSRRERGIHFEDEDSRSSSFYRRRTRSGRGANLGKKRRSFMPQRSHSYSSDNDSNMSSDIEAVVAAAALAVSIHADYSSSSSSSRENSPYSRKPQNLRSSMPAIEKEPSLSRRHYDQDVNNNVDSNSRALVPLSSMDRKSKDAMALVPSSSMERKSRDSMALVPSSSMERKSKDEMAIVPVPSRKNSKRDSESASGRWDKQIVPFGTGASDRNSSKAEEIRKRSEIIYDESTRGKKEAKAAAWLQAEIARIEHRLGMKADAIHAWENERINKEDMVFKEIERKLNVQRRKAFEQMRSEIERVSQKAEREREKMNTKKDAEMEAALRRAEKIRGSGRAPSEFCSCC